MAELDDLLADLFAPMGDMMLCRMFGGIGIFRAGLMFGLPPLRLTMLASGHLRMFRRSADMSGCRATAEILFRR